MQNESKPRTIGDLREQLLEAFDAVKKDPRRAPQVKEQINAAGKVLLSLKLEMEYSFLHGEEPEIPFMGKTSGRPLKPQARLLGAA